MVPSVASVFGRRRSRCFASLLKVELGHSKASRSPTLATRSKSSLSPIHNEQPNSHASRSDISAFTRGCALTLAAFIVGHSFMEYCYNTAWAYGISMTPTLNAFGDLLVVSKWHRRGRDVVVGDVISFRNPTKSREMAVKRVMGMPGDFVLETTPEAERPRMIQVPEGHCWVVGDNLNHSRDSRVFGPLPLALITGKIIARVDTSNRPLPTVSSVPNGLTSPA